MSRRPSTARLAAWAERGVLLLNASLTVEEGRPGSHAKKGWETLTDSLLALVAARASPCVYLLWGAHAQAKAGLIRETASRHGREILILQANHPSPLSARRPPVPFLGCGHFTLARDWLASARISRPVRARGRGGATCAVARPGGRPDPPTRGVKGQVPRDPGGQNMLYFEVRRRGARVAKGGRL